MSQPSDAPKETWPDDRLLKAAHEGDTDAFAIFCVRSLPGLRRYLRSQCEMAGVPIVEAGDFAQETILKALKEIASYHVSGHRPLPKVSIAWLFQIGYNLMVDWLRKNRRVQTIQIMEESVRAREPDQKTKEQYEKVLSFFNWLKPRDREIIELVLIQDMDIVSAGAELGLDKWAAYKAYERALETLRDLIAEHGNEDEY